MDSRQWNSQRDIALSTVGDKQYRQEALMRNGSMRTMFEEQSMRKILSQQEDDLVHCKLSHIQHGHGSNVDELRTRVQVLQMELFAKDQELSRLTKRNKKVREGEGSNAEINRSEDYKAMTDALESKAKELVQSQKQRERAFKVAKQSAMAAKQSAMALKLMESTLTQRDKVICDLKARLEETESGAAQLKEWVAERNEEIKETRDYLEGVEGQLKVSLQASMTQKEKMEKMLKKKNAEIDQCKEEMQALRDVIKVHEEEKAEVKVILEREEQTVLRSATAQHQEMKHTLREKDAEIDRMKANLHALKGVLKVYEKETYDAEAMQEELEKARKKLAARDDLILSLKNGKRGMTNK